MRTRITVAEAIEIVTGLAGRARRRTLDRHDLLQALIEAREDAYGCQAGAEVANCYGYPARRMRIATVRLPDGDYLLMCDWGNAHRNSSDCACLGGRQDGKSGWDSTLRAWSAGITGPPEDLGYRIAGRSVIAAIARIRVEARERAATQWPTDAAPEAVEVSVEDSIRAGNCERITREVAAKYFAGREAVSASELRTTILREEPALARYARRAVESAMARA